MKVLIQNCNSHEYYAGREAWTPEPDHALKFPSSLKAMEYMYEAGLHPAKVVLKFHEPRYDVEVAKTADC
jgi:hypothetical protein